MPLTAVFETRNGTKEELTLQIDPSRINHSSPYLAGERLDGLFCPTTCVGDAWRYDLEVQGEKRTWLRFEEGTLSSEYNDRPSEAPGKGKVILLLLESPHTSEYSLEEGRIVPKAPAQGKSPAEAGGGIDRYFPKILNQINLPSGRYSILISNPVPYHASLGHLIPGKLDRKIRDAVWKSLWSLPAVREDFSQRLERYCPHLVINACTKSLQGLVSSFLLDKGLGPQTYTISHPAITWNIRKEKTPLVKL